MNTKQKNSRNRGCVMKYPWMRNEISADISLNNRGYVNYWASQAEKMGDIGKSYLTYDNVNLYNILLLLL